jgi:single-strand selective monofunctional uracil DNA glycosylase
VTHVYNPIVYARAPFDLYLRRYGKRPKEIVLLGMNPGPFGMAQTGVPFGEVSMVREWLRIERPVGKPEPEHPRRPVTGFACPRSEVSGRRLWGWVRNTFQTPERFFARFFVVNYCPLLFLEASGRGRTPDRISATERRALFAICDEALRHTIAYLRPRYVVGIGRFAEERARRALGNRDVSIGRVPHPSPASPAANRGWESQVRDAFESLGIPL